MAKLSTKKVVKKAPVKKVKEELVVTPMDIVNMVLTEEEKEEVRVECKKDTRTAEEKFTAGIDKLIDAQIRAGGTQFLSKSEIINTFRSSI